MQCYIYHLIYTDHFVKIDHHSISSNSLSSSSSVGRSSIDSSLSRTCWIFAAAAVSPFSIAKRNAPLSLWISNPRSMFLVTLALVD
mmetsp:Transcript_16705/g.25230  ORF Transcript_16705/g.25230 Transcript_16705/m.25230 type:complete len:86 (+) Transcript_16705:86-343(+)